MILESFIFRIGELHVVFTMLNVLGMYILDSGIDRLFVEAGIYGPTTLGQIIEGKCMKKGIKAYFAIVFSSFFYSFERSIEWLKIEMKGGSNKRLQIS